MKRMALAVVVLVASAGAGRAENVPQILGIPTGYEYTPGQQFSFQLGIPNLPGLTEYSVTVLITSEDGTVASSLNVTQGSPYPFVGSSGPGVAPIGGPNPSEAGFLISDSRGALALAPGTSFVLANVTVTPGSNVVGPITIQVIDRQFEYEQGGEGDPGLGDFDSVTIGRAPDPVPVPAPPGIVLLATAGVILGARRRVLRAA